MYNVNYIIYIYYYIVQSHTYIYIYGIYMLYNAGNIIIDVPFGNGLYLL